LAATKGTRTGGELLAKNAGKSLVRVVTGIERDRHDGSRGGVELPPGTFKAETAHEGLDGFSYHAGENAVKVIGRKAGDFGEFGQGQGVIERGSNVSEDSEEARLVILLGDGFYRTPTVLTYLKSDGLMVLAQIED
jgi:hypothetical protein